MSQTKNTDKNAKQGNTNSDEIARSIIQPIVDQAAGSNKGGGGTHSKPPLPHNTNTTDKNPKNNNNNNKKEKAMNLPTEPSSLQFQKSSTNRHMVFHPDHPEKIYELDSTSTAHSHSSNSTPDPTIEIKKDKASASLVSIPRRSGHQHTQKGGGGGGATIDELKATNASNNDGKESSNIGLTENSRNGVMKTNDDETSKTKHKNNPKSNENDKSNNSNNSNKLSSSSHNKSSAANSANSGLSREQRRERRRRLEDPSCFPKRYEVQVQARVRVGKELTSQHLTDLPEGSVVTVEEIQGHRARISRPLCGWLSVTSKFGARIILPTNSKYSKIGGKVMFNRPVNGQKVQAKVVDYNEENNLYKIRYENNTSEWIDIEDQNIQFISQHKAVKVQKPLNVTAPTFTLQTSQAFFNQFFCKDYPQYQAQSSSTTRHMDISRVQQQQAAAAAAAANGRYPPTHGPYPGQGPPGSHPPTAGTGHTHGHPPPGGHPANLRHPGHPPHGPPNTGPYPGPHGQPPHNPAYPGHPPHGHPPPGHPQHPPHGVPPPHGQQPGYPPHGGPPHPQQTGHPTRGPHPGHPPRGYPNGAPPPQNGQQPTNGAPPYTQHPAQGPSSRHRSDRNNETSKDSRTVTAGDNNKNDTSSLEQTKKTKTTSEEFIQKVKEIERRIIQHLHQRGYDESHPDYHRYLQKAKELAIQKAGKEREKMLAQAERARAQKGISRAQYENYLRYSQEKQRQHAIAEAARKQRLAEEQRRQQQAAAAAGGSGNKLTGQSKSSSVKGLIVLRGLPGSGKTTLAKKLAQRSKNARICTEDRYHWSGKEDGVGEYKFQPQLVFLAREWCTKEIRECIESNVNLIILDNHNARISMYEDHIQYAVEHGYRFRIIEFVATASLIDKYRARSYKKFPREVYVKLLKLWEHDPRTELINPTFGDNKVAKKNNENTNTNQDAAKKTGAEDKQAPNGGDKNGAGDEDKAKKGQNDDNAPNDPQ